MTTESHINQLFNNLDTWRHLPAYQLERRTDIFFSLYLPEMLKTRFKLKQTPILIPEFPCRYGSIDPAGNNQSFKVDYLAISMADKKAYFVELKTDMNSRNGAQDANMQKAQKVKLIKLLEGLKDMHKASVEKTKYKALSLYIATQLGQPEAIDRDGDIEVSNFKRLENVTPEIVYVQPTHSHEISFSEFADEVGKHAKADAVSKRFEMSLRKWVTESV